MRALGRATAWASKIGGSLEPTVPVQVPERKISDLSNDVAATPSPPRKFGVWALATMKNLLLHEVVLRMPTSDRPVAKAFPQGLREDVIGVAELRLICCPGHEGLRCLAVVLQSAGLVIDDRSSGRSSWQIGLGSESE